MADFRKISVLAALVLLLGLVSTVSAQTGPAFTCVANAAVPPTIRAEGLTEFVGDIVIDCTGGIPTLTTGTVPQVNFVVYLNTAVTSRTYNTSTPALSEALLLVDEPGTTTNTNSAYYCSAASNNAGCTFPGLSTTAGSAAPVVTPYCGAPTGGTAPCITGNATARPNAYAGLVQGNQVTFIGVPVDAPGTAGHRIFRITNIRANASGISAGPSGTPGTIQALVSASGSTSVPISNPSLLVGFVTTGLNFFVRKADAVLNADTASAQDIARAQCQTITRKDIPPGDGSNSVVLRYQENFPTSFKVKETLATGPTGIVGQSVPGNVWNTESDFFYANGIPNAPSGSGVTSINGLANVGRADYGTRLKAVFNNVPAGVSVYASIASLSTTAQATLITSEGTAFNPTPATSNDFKCYSGVPGVSSTCQGNPATAGWGAQLPVVNGTTTAVWEVVQANSLASENYQFYVWFSFTAAAAQNSPAPGTSTVTGGFAPTPAGLGVSASTAATYSNVLPVPRFIEGTQTKNWLTIFVCRTNLLFPFVTNQQGFDTGLAISNTSSDPFGTAAQAGTCTLFSYGANAPASIPTPNIPAGTSYVTTASTSMPNFQGYIIAQCGFQYAHGFAFVSDFGARNLAMGYLALIIPEPGTGTRAASTNALSGAGAGEQLAQ